MQTSDTARSDRDRDDDPLKPSGDKPANTAPDAVKDPSEKTGGKPGHPGEGNEVDPGGG